MACEIRVGDSNGLTVIFGQEAWWKGRYENLEDAERFLANLKLAYEQAEIVEL
jgi:hypothetical protein